MDSSSIYDDLHDTDLGENVIKLQQGNEKLLNHIKSLEEDIDKLCKELIKLKKSEDNLKRNISELFNTSKVEIERKDRMISELRKQLDDMLFKRRNAYQNRIRNEETSFTGLNLNNKRPGVDDAFESYKRQKLESMDEPKLQSELIIKREKLQEKNGRESSRSYSNSPSRTRSTYRNKDRKRSRSKSKTRSGYRSRERRRSRSRSNDRNRSRHRNERSDKFSGKDLRSVLSDRLKPRETAIKNHNISKIFVKKEAINRDLNRRVGYESSSSPSYKTKINKPTDVDKKNHKIEKNPNVEHKTKTTVNKTNQNSGRILNEQLKSDKLTKIKQEIDISTNMCYKINDEAVVQSNEINQLIDQNQIKTEADEVFCIKKGLEINTTNPNCNAPVKQEDISFLDTKVEIVTNFEEGIKESKNDTVVKINLNNFETKPDVKRELKYEQDQNDVTVCNISSRTNNNSHRRRRCVIKVLN